MPTFDTTPATPGPTPPVLTAAYTTLDDLNAVDGATSLATYSNLDGDSTDPDYTRIQLAMTNADVRVNQYLRRYRGGAATSVPSTDSGFELLKQAAAYYATAWVYGSRGARDVTDAVTGQFNPMLNKANYWNAQAKRLLDQYIESSLNTLPPGTFQAIDIERDSDSFGVPAFPFGW